MCAVSPPPIIIAKRHSLSNSFLQTRKNSPQNNTYLAYHHIATILLWQDNIKICP